jgi:endoglucanase
VGWPKWQVTEVMSRRPQVRVNQLGYLPGRPKQATLISDAQDPVPFAIRDRDGVVVYTGFSRPWSVRPETTSGRNVHVLDFTGLTMQGAGFQIESADQSGHPFEVTNSVYNRLRADALGFFYVMRSGTPILDSVAPGYGRPAGHAGQPPNRGDSAVPAWTGVEARRLIRDGVARALLTFRVAGMTRATTASTSQAAALRCGSSSAR